MRNRARARYFGDLRSRDHLVSLGMAFGGVFCVIVLRWSWLKPYTTWARLSLPCYVAGFCVSLWTMGHNRRFRPALWALLLVGTIVVPLGVLLRHEGPRPSVSAQSEVIVVEQAAVTISNLRNPYTALDPSPELSRLEQPTRDHFPYMPGMAVLGIARAITTSRIGDMRLVSVVICGLVVALFLTPRRRHFASAIVALPPTALIATTGGDDLIVVVLVLVGFAAIHRRSWAQAGLILGVALALKQTAWPLVAVAIVWLATTHTRAIATRVAAIAGGLATIVLAPFLLWNFRSAWEDLVTFPLHGSHRDVVNSPTVGGLLARALGLAESTLSRTMMILVVIAVIWALKQWHLETVWHAAALGASALGAMVLLSPGVRPGLLIYPVIICAWAIFEIRQPDEKATSTPLLRGALGGPGRI